MSKKGGRKGKYETHVKPHLKKIAGWKRQGATESEIFERLGVGESNWYRYKKDHKELQEALKMGLDESIIYAENALFKSMASGNVAAIIFYLKSKGGYMEEFQKQSIKLKKQENEIMETQTGNKDLQSFIGALNAVQEDK